MNIKEALLYLIEGKYMRRPHGNLVRCPHGRADDGSIKPTSEAIANLTQAIGMIHTVCTMSWGSRFSYLFALEEDILQVTKKTFKVFNMSRADLGASDWEIVEPQ